MTAETRLCKKNLHPLTDGNLTREGGCRECRCAYDRARKRAAKGRKTTQDMLAKANHCEWCGRWLNEAMIVLCSRCDARKIWTIKTPTFGEAWI